MCPALSLFFGVDVLNSSSVYDLPQEAGHGSSGSRRVERCRGFLEWKSRQAAVVHAYLVQIR